MAQNDYEVSRKVGMINPYTFVPIRTEKIQRQNGEAYYAKGNLHTGVLECTLQVKTPLAIPNIEKAFPDPKHSDHVCYPFYREDDQAVIPGSSLRGMLRSVYETITGSCFSTMKADTPLSSRDRQYVPGILRKENGTMVLYNADRYRIPMGKIVTSTANQKKREIIGADGAVLKTGDWVQFTCDRRKRVIKLEKMTEDRTKSFGNCQSGILMIGEPSRNKKSEGILVLGKQELYSESQLKLAYERLLQTLSFYRNQSINRNLGSSKTDHHGYAGYEELNLESGIPLWFKGDSKQNSIHFSYAGIGRMVFQNSLNDLVGQLDRCRDRKAVCPACLMFGMVGGSGEQQGLGGRIRVTNAYAGEKPKLEYETLKILGMPRNSYFPFYAQNESGKKSVLSYDDQSASISGRKFYWHHNMETESIALGSYGTKEKSNQNATMELVMPDNSAEFSFKIYYDGISEEQLRALIWAVTLGENDVRGTQCHKLGHGKPLGLGSVKITVTRQVERIWNPEDGYQLKPMTIHPEIKAVDPAVMKAVLKVLNLEEPLKGVNKKCNIEYPFIVDKNDGIIPEHLTQKNNALARHQWYSQNKGSKTEFQPLPKLLDSSQVLKAYRYKKDIKNGDDSKNTNHQSQTVFSNKGISFEKGELYPAVVTGYNVKKTSVRIRVKDNGVSGQIYFKDIPGAKYGAVDQCYSVNEMIQVRFKGTSEFNGRTNYDFYV